MARADGRTSSESQQGSRIPRPAPGRHRARDHSCNRRRTWCSMELCGNRAKARASHSRKSNLRAEH
ncbi:CGNR zinc finger domain-containing protein [Streptomyces sp. NPDC086554]|uniref:CGNR zinc finger domain-containing protein n=1 Tax=Streptomyces sp. NPDC086554 TaxID=3154864 RepID=UPI00341918E2